MLIRHLATATRMTVVTTVLLGLAYPLIITGLAQVLFPDQANGQLIVRNGQVIGSRIIGQPFASAGYFYSRPSAAGSGYDAGASSGSNLGPTSQKLIERVAGDVARLQPDNPGVSIPIDLVTSSASGLDPHISPAYARLQAPRVAQARGVPVDVVLAAVERHTTQPVLGFLGRPGVDVLGVNLDLDRAAPVR